MGFMKCGPTVKDLGDLDKDGNYHGYKKGFDEDGNLSCCVYYHHGVKLADFHGYELLE